MSISSHVTYPKTLIPGLSAIYYLHLFVSCIMGTQFSRKVSTETTRAHLRRHGNARRRLRPALRRRHVVRHFAARARGLGRRTRRDDASAILLCDGRRYFAAHAAPLTLTSVCARGSSPVAGGATGGDSLNCHFVMSSTDVASHAGQTGRGLAAGLEENKTITMSRN